MKIELLKKNIQTLTEAIANCSKRFPVTVAFVLAFSVYLIYLIATETECDIKACTITGYYLSMGAMLSLSMHLWGEEYKSRTKAISVHAITQAILIADAIFLYNAQQDIETVIAHEAGIFALWLSIFFLSFLKETTDIAACNFTSRVIYSFIKACIIGAIMSGGICLLIYSLEQLFGININPDYYLYVCVVCNVTLPSLLFLGILPKGELKHDNVPQHTGFNEGIIRYLFIPLIIGYMAVLYFYGGKILLTWELPNGWVSWLVVTLMAGCIIIEYLIYPLRHANTQKWKEITAIWIPLLVLPLLLLMTVGIAKRFNDYGITINRLYLATLNAWFYLICIGLIATKARRINWIPISFSIIFTVTSILPINYSSITKNVLQNEVEKSLMEAGQTSLPLSEPQYIEWLNSLPNKKREHINEKLNYLKITFGESSISKFINPSISLYNTKNCTQTHLSGCTSIESCIIRIPDNYKLFKSLNVCNLNIPHEKSRNGILEVPLQSVKDTFCLQTDTLKSINEIQYGEMPPLSIKCKSGKREIILKSFLYNYDSSEKYIQFSFEGYLFYNE